MREGNSLILYLPCARNYKCMTVSLKRALFYTHEKTEIQKLRICLWTQAVGTGLKTGQIRSLCLFFVPCQDIWAEWAYGEASAKLWVCQALSPGSQTSLFIILGINWPLRSCSLIVISPNGWSHQAVVSNVPCGKCGRTFQTITDKRS